MKRILFILSCLVVSGLVYAGLQNEVTAPTLKPERKICKGYEIIEAGKGINCHGDTIKLTRRPGFYEVAANYSND